MVKKGHCLNLQQHELIRPITYEEIYEAINSMPKKQCPRGGWVLVEFFSRNREIVKVDMVEAMQYFFRTGVMYPAINITAITLIP
ncbi:hypothetical protein RDI58_007124 [Solanum bulbocastanum]|uniref:Uncharacterized protein n=1 Tax=Solanum bulbocastanum TaxID=147425 RepID=A0AAN8U0E5_SOLBU